SRDRDCCSGADVKLAEFESNQLTLLRSYSCISNTQLSSTNSVSEPLGNFSFTRKRGACLVTNTSYVSAPLRLSIRYERGTVSKEPAGTAVVSLSPIRTFTTEFPAPGS